MEPAQETTPELTPDSRNDGDRQQLDSDDAGEDDVVVQTNEKPSKIEDIDGDPVVEDATILRSETTSTSITLEWTAPADPLGVTLATPTGYRIWQTSGDAFANYDAYYLRPVSQRLSQTLAPQTHRAPLRA